MGESSDAKIGWGIDLGDEENDWGDGKFVALGVRFHERDESFSDWAGDILPSLYVDKAERDAKLKTLRAAFDSKGAIDEQHAQYCASHDAILAQYPVPVIAGVYGYEWNAHALLLKRSYTTVDWGSIAVDPATLAPPTDDEMVALRLAVESLGLTWDPADVVLLLMAQYG